VEAQTDLQQAVRRSLAGAAADMRPTGADLAGRAIRVGRWRRVWRGASGALALRATTMVASGVPLHQPPPTVSPYLGVGLAAPTPQPDPTVPASPPAARSVPPLEGHAGWIAAGATDDRLMLSVGGEADIDLRYVRGVVSAHRAGDGWALVTGGEYPRLHWVSERHPPRLVLGGVDTLVVADERVAWRRGVVLGSARISASGSLAQRSTVEVSVPAPDPVGFLGDVVVLRSPSSSGAGSWGLWRPDVDHAPRAVSTPVTALFGAMPDGQTAVGLVPETDGQCLALLDGAHGLTADPVVCLPSLPVADSPASLSPDGRWLLGSHRPPGSADAPETVQGSGPGTDGPAVVDGVAGAVEEAAAVTVLVDVQAALAGAQTAVAEVGGVPPPLGRAVWPDQVSVYYPVPGGVVHLHPELWMAGDEGAVEVLPHPGEPVVLVELA
jgi:hypothetical protein